MSTAAGDPIVAEDFIGDIDTLQAQVAGLDANAAGQQLQINDLGYLGRKAHQLETSDQRVANDGTPHSSTAISFNTAGGRLIKVSFSCILSSSDVGDSIKVLCYDDDAGVPIPGAITGGTFETANGELPGGFIAMTAPTAGFHTYKLYITRPFGTGTGGFLANAWLMVEDFGGAV